MRSLKDGIRSLVRIDFKGQVHKQFRGTAASERCANEVTVLKVLEERGCPHVPRLISADLEANVIVTTNCGQPVEDSIPRKKADILFKELEEHFGVRHDDPEPRNITYDPRRGKFCIIDFELAEVLPEPQLASAEDAIRIQWASDSKQGRRHLTNQDSHLALRINSRGEVQRAHKGEGLLPCRKALFAVCDGVGGNSGGEFASRLALSRAAHRLEKAEYGTMDEAGFDDFIQSLNIYVNLRALENPKASRLATTFAGVLLQEDQITWANVGDSRVYRVRDGKMQQLSKDHCFEFRKWKAGEISEMQYRLSPIKNRIFDCLGAGNLRVNPEMGTEKWQCDDLYLVCSDGIIDGLSERKLESIMVETEAGLNESKAHKVCQELLKQAVANAGSDDTTLVVFQLL